MLQLLMFLLGDNVATKEGYLACYQNVTKICYLHYVCYIME